MDKIVYMPAIEPNFLLMGLMSIQPYAPHQVYRLLERWQIVPKYEYLSIRVVEIGPDGQFLEALVRKIGNEWQYLTANICLQDQGRGEVSPGYLAWYRREIEFGRPPKRPHLQEFIETSQEQWDWLSKKNEYRATIGKLEKQVKDLQFENGLQFAADEGERKRLTKENETLQAQI